MQLTYLDSGRSAYFEPTEKIGAGSAKSVLSGRLSTARKNVHCVLAQYTIQAAARALSLAEKHRTIQAAGIPTFASCDVVQTDDGHMGALLPNLATEGKSVLSANDYRNDTSKIGRVTIPRQRYRGLVQALLRIAKQTTKANVKLSPDTPFYRIAQDGNSYLLEGVLLGDLDDVRLHQTESGLPEYNEYMMMSNFADFRDIYCRR